MKAQVSIEYLLLALVGLVLIALSVSALLYLSGFWNQAKARQSYLFDKRVLLDTVEEVCILGDGTSRVVHINYYNDSLNSTCPVEYSELSGTLVIKNVNGKVVIQKP